MYHSGDTEDQLATPNADRRRCIAGPQASARYRRFVKREKSADQETESIRIYGRRGGRRNRGPGKTAERNFELVFTDLDMPRLGGMNCYLIFNAVDTEMLPWLLSAVETKTNFGSRRWITEPSTI